MKTLFHLIAIIGLALGWLSYKENYKSDDENYQELVKLEQSGATEEEMVKAESEQEADQNAVVFMGILLTLLTAGYIGVVFVLYILPMLAHRATQSVYDSTEQVEPDAMSKARSKMAQGDYDEAISEFHTAAKEDPMNRVPYLEIAKIQRQHQANPDAAISTLTTAIEGQEWEENDAAFLMFRLAEIYQEDKGDMAAASTVMQQVIDQFPQTRHSANASHKLQEWKRAGV